MSFDQYRIELDFIRDKVTNKDPADHYRTVNEYKENLRKSLLSPTILNAWNSWKTQFNNRHNTKITNIHNPGIKFAQIFSMYDNINAATFLAELPGTSAIMLKFLYPDIPIKLNSPIESKPFLQDDMNLVDTIFWYNTQYSGKLEDKQFLKQVATDSSLYGGLLVSDMGTAMPNEQYKLQYIQADAMLYLMENTTTDLGKDGLVYKMYDFDKDDILETISKTTAYFDYCDIIKPEGSPISTDEVYIVCKDRNLTPKATEFLIDDEPLNVPKNQPVSIYEIKKKRSEIRELTRKYYFDFKNRKLTINYDILKNTQRFIEQRIHRNY